MSKKLLYGSILILVLLAFLSQTTLAAPQEAGYGCFGISSQPGIITRVRQSVVNGVWVVTVKTGRYVGNATTTRWLHRNQNVIVNGTVCGSAQYGYRLTIKTIF